MCKWDVKLCSFLYYLLTLLSFGQVINLLVNRFILKAFEISCTFVSVFVAVPGEFTYHNFYILAVNFYIHNLMFKEYGHFGPW